MFDKTKCSIKAKYANLPFFNEPHCGTNFGFMENRGFFSTPEALKQPEIMRKHGVNYCILNVMFCQEKYCSTKVFLDFKRSASENEMTDMVKALHDNGIRIILKPCVIPLDGAWMGKIHFPDLSLIEGMDNSSYWQKWFESFTECTRYYAEFAAKNNVEGYMCGCEYYGTEYKDAEWRKVVSTVRSIYDGPLTYEFTFASRKAYQLKWFEELDFLSYSYYPPARPLNNNLAELKELPHTTLDEMVEFLKPRRERIQQISERFGNKPIAFTEIGTRSAHGCIASPSNFQADSPYDGEEQANYMEALFRTFSDMPQWLGMYWWKWDGSSTRAVYQGDPAGDRSFSIKDKPAETVFKKWSDKLRMM